MSGDTIIRLSLIQEKSTTLQKVGEQGFCFWSSSACWTAFWCFWVNGAWDLYKFLISSQRLLDFIRTFLNRILCRFDSVYQEMTVGRIVVFFNLDCLGSYMKLRSPTWTYISLNRNFQMFEKYIYVIFQKYWLWTL